MIALHIFGPKFHSNGFRLPIISILDMVKKHNLHTLIPSQFQNFNINNILLDPSIDPNGRRRPWLLHRQETVQRLSWQRLGRTETSMQDGTRFATNSLPTVTMAPVRSLPPLLVSVFFLSSPPSPLLSRYINRTDHSRPHSWLAFIHIILFHPLCLVGLVLYPLLVTPVLIKKIDAIIKVFVFVLFLFYKSILYLKFG